MLTVPNGSCWWGSLQTHWFQWGVVNQTKRVGGARARGSLRARRREQLTDDTQPPQHTHTHHKYCHTISIWYAWSSCCPSLDTFQNLWRQSCKIDDLYLPVTTKYVGIQWHGSVKIIGVTQLKIQLETDKRLQYTYLLVGDLLECLTTPSICNTLHTKSWSWHCISVCES